MSVLDQNLGWGECDLTPALVATEAKTTPWLSAPEYAAPTPADAADSVFDVSGVHLPLRAHIVKRMFHFRTLDKPWKSWFDFEVGKGWLVVTATGWRFFPQEHR